MTREEVEEEIRADLAKLNCAQSDFSLPDCAPADPHVLGEGPEFTYIYRDKQRTVDGAELVFLFVEQMTVKLVRDAEELTREAKKAGFLARFRTKRGGFGCGADNYSRQTWMEGHVRLMSAVHEGWGTRVALNYEMMLRKFPLTPEERTNTRKLDLTAYGVE